METDSFFGLDVTQLSQLLAIGNDKGLTDESIRQDAQISRSLIAILSAPLAISMPMPNTFPEVLKRECPELDALGNKTLAEILVDPTTDIAILQTIKAYYKKMVSRASSDIDHSVAITLYIAAIATALIYKDEKITHHSDSQLQEYFDMLYNKEWMLPELIRLFSKASLQCQATK